MGYTRTLYGCKSPLTFPLICFKLTRADHFRETTEEEVSTDLEEGKESEKHKKRNMREEPLR